MVLVFEGVRVFNVKSLGMNPEAKSSSVSLCIDLLLTECKAIAGFLLKSAFCEFLEGNTQCWIFELGSTVSRQKP